MKRLYGVVLACVLVWPLFNVIEQAIVGTVEPKVAFIFLGLPVVAILGPSMLTIFKIGDFSVQRFDDNFRVSIERFIAIFELFYFYASARILVLWLENTQSEIAEPLFGGVAFSLLLTEYARRAYVKE